MHRSLLLLLLIVESLPLDSAVAAIPRALDGPELKSSANEYLPRQSTGDDNAGEIPADDGSAIGTVNARRGAAEIPAISPDNPEFESQAPISIDYAALDAGLCARAALSAERIYRIPDQFLVAMGRVESGRRISSGRVVAWPWTVNAQGRGYIYQSEQQAIEAVRAFRAQGVTSIDVGCMQVNLQQHPNAFPSLEAAFDPAANANYAARFLTDLFGRTGSWPGAAAAYHSFTPDIGNAYQWKVLESWAAPLGGAGRIATPGSPRVTIADRRCGLPFVPYGVGRPLNEAIQPSDSRFYAAPLAAFDGLWEWSNACVLSCKRDPRRPAAIIASRTFLTGRQSTGDRQAESFVLYE
ncbi:transglycosylase SLT domain-containing protein [Acetobacter sacchari]|uniref:transglycosylase SLT domain-containing protein n=1 Tax=Acetobacter sacchari TaxID=2661687 RepID=UPI001FB02A97|nr:transglycosylase SLT domain-containing protein [Acetobacter sacchari]